MLPPQVRPYPNAIPWLTELEPVVSRLLGRHLETAREWFPHQYVPWGEGSDFDGPLGGTPWRESESALTPAARSALVLSLLTEDNLPTYHHELAATVGRDGAWGHWVHRWSAEEDRHTAVLRAYVHTTRAVDPVALERARMRHMSTPVPDGNFPRGMSGLAYVMIQELATRVSHRNIGLGVGEPVCGKIFARIAQDENLHMVFYRDLYAALLELAPDDAMGALLTTVRAFRMPGDSIPGFANLSAQLAMAGWYDPGVHLDSVLLPLVRSLRLLDRTDLGPDGERHRDELARHLDELRARARRFEDFRERRNTP